MILQLCYQLVLKREEDKVKELALFQKSLEFEQRHEKPKGAINLFILGWA